jgi:ribose/xylose/arabinose/galactoside ABC-type transport system permease subunit
MASDFIHGALARLNSLARSQHGGLIGVILLLGLVLTFVPAPVWVTGEGGQLAPINNFLRLDNLLPNVATPMSYIAIMAIGATFVIISGGIDISVGSIMGLAALGCAAVLEYPKDADPASAWVVMTLGVVVPVGIGLVCGLINGVLVVSLRIHPFIVTLGTMSIFRGVALVAVLAAGSAMMPLPGYKMPEVFTKHFMQFTAASTSGGIQLQPMPMLIMLLCVVVAWLYLGRTAAGRQIYAVGGNEEAARFSGIPVGRAKIRVYAASGLSAGIAGMIACGFYSAASTNTAEGYELMVIAAAVVGGASLLGGRGTALGAVLGALVIKLIENGIDVLHLSKEYSKIIIGVAIIVAVAIDRASEDLRGERLARKTARPSEGTPDTETHQ